MSVYIRGMEMPTCCDYCPISVKVGLHGTNKIVNFCRIAKRYDDYAPNIIPPHCPLIPVPDHGRLIDADALAESHRRRANQCTGNSYSFHMTARAWVNDATTIIPADKED